MQAIRGQTAVVTVQAAVPAPPAEQLQLLTLQPAPQHHNVTWEEGTVDNEHMDKKKSKKCCIYHKPREFGESSSESEGDDHPCSHQHCSHQHKNKKKNKKPIPKKFPDEQQQQPQGGPSGSGPQQQPQSSSGSSG
ncbi:unnamed protein product [Vitrella brassicaformis CCMP3155]|uniref:Protein phosphatase 1 regulatory subunit 11 n=1 Tax=Vitrella brassicaformis (strain CCMP3155) TaxID=1169540 RepID=A0A0G4GSE0_VITBC|nr:unnamed protein product [Vitrella brassicaformis CCMP3155]|eukprot:CEM33346.1 unnamed protein product [Vitrella brassicaformis CCMP3155]